ncbi:MAG: hypothetical protein ACLUCI_03790 [Blautia hansenii]|jgi:hypothetical protein
MARAKENQLSIFDFLKMEDEPEILYKKGDILFHQLKGEIKKYTVTGETWLCHEDNRGYRIQAENGMYNVVTNDSIDFYRTQKEAEEAAKKWLNGKDVIPPERIIFSSVDVYQYIRECDGRKMTAFLGVMEGGNLYEKNFYTYHHVVKDSKKARKSFCEELEQYANCNVKKIEGYVPEVKQMYRCKEGDTWLYAEAGYGGAIG